LWNLEFDFDFDFFFFENSLEDFNGRLIAINHQGWSNSLQNTKGAVRSRRKIPRGSRISLQNTKGRLDLATNTKGRSNLASKHQGTVRFHRKIQKPAKEN